ncbi:alpha/beta hydrolase [Flavobacterium agricola]|uniref:Alpha/beta hydrolase n=1 Tax=Flavobacterium agricola TaxID=2870839 RepID=A0ABY6LXV0_9FLAO|nr:alpha/beta hydrolase-fold protein [Flavobacterium agricola]UYW01160.1 alpha/beta hydrolase [Flavobacterium agricola]
MKLKLTLLLLSLFSLSMYSQRIVETIKSKKVNASREIQIILPRGYEEKKDQKFPLLVVLDADYLMAPTASNIRYAVNFDEYLDFVIVGINQAVNNDRALDSEFEYNGVPSVNGGAFYEFLTMEVVPYIESKYRVQPFRAILGHGVTAAFINAFLYKDNPYFNAYISMSPILANNMETIVADRLQAAEKPIFYYLSYSDGDITEDKANIVKLNENINAINNKNVFYKFEYFPRGGHYSYVLQAIPSALNFIFKDYRRIDLDEYHNKLLVLENNQTQYLLDKYTDIANNFNFIPTIRLNDFEATEAAILKKENYDELKALAKVAEKHYPRTMLGSYYLALYEEKTENWAAAEKAYLKAFTMEPIGKLSKNLMVENSEAAKANIPEKVRKSKRTKKGKEQSDEE